MTRPNAVIATPRAMSGCGSRGSRFCASRMTVSLSDLASVLDTVGATVEARLARAVSGRVAPLSRPNLTAGPSSPAEGGGSMRPASRP